MPQAAGLLRFFKWNKDKLLTRFFDDPDGVLELAGVKVKAVPDSAGSDEMVFYYYYYYYYYYFFFIYFFFLFLTDSSFLFFVLFFFFSFLGDCDGGK